MNYPFAIGDRIQLVSTNRIGKIVALQQDRATVMFEYVTLTVPTTQLIPCSQGNGFQSPRLDDFSSHYTRAFDIRAFISFHPEIDLHGLTVAESLIALERWLDQALLAGHTQLRVIHGKGTGTLRQQVYLYLKRQSFVKKIIRDHSWPGGVGVTCVEL